MSAPSRRHSFAAPSNVPNPNPPGQATVSNYRLDPAHANRHLVTTFSADLDRPRMMPMYLNQVAGATPGTGTALYRDAATGLLVNPWTGQPFPRPQAPGSITDFGTNGTTNQWQNVRLALGAIDLNRTLADYRARSHTPLMPANMAAANVTVGSVMVRQAEADRQRFARDIFARLVIATGAQAQVATAADHRRPDHLQHRRRDYLRDARHARVRTRCGNWPRSPSNIVDYIDSDDISTPFVWNPQNPGPDPHNAASTSDADRDLQPRGLRRREAAPDADRGLRRGDQRSDRPGSRWNRRIWTLTSASGSSSRTRPHRGAATRPLGDGSVKLQYNAAELGREPEFQPVSGRHRPEHQGDAHDFAEPPRPGRQRDQREGRHRRRCRPALQLHERPAQRES